VHCIARGWSIAALAREFNLSRHTVRRYVETDVAPRYAPRGVPRQPQPGAARPRRSPAGCQLHDPGDHALSGSESARLRGRLPELRAQGSEVCANNGTKSLPSAS
jgi:hypothetical protein